MSLPYFPMFPSDFEAKTSHLTLAEDGAYNRLLRICWMTPGCTIPTDEAWIMRRVRAHTDADKEAVRAILSEYFTVQNGRYSNAKLMRIWREANEAHEKRKNAGSKGGKAKALKTNETASSNALAKPKQPEPEPELNTLEDKSSNEGQAFDASEAAIWKRGVPFLSERGVAEPKARQMIGKWIRDHGSADLFKALSEAAKSGTGDPIPYITKILTQPAQTSVAEMVKRAGEKLRHA